LKNIEDENSAEAVSARGDLLEALIEAQQTEQNEFDATVQDDDLHDAWVGWRQKWNAKGARIARFGVGGALAATALIPGANVMSLIGRGTLGAIGGVFATDALLEKYGPLAQKGEADRIANEIVKGGKAKRIWNKIKFIGRGEKRQEFEQGRLEDNRQAAQDAVDALDRDLLLNELGRLQALQVFKASDIYGASGTTGEEITAVIKMIQKRAYNILGKEAVASVEKSKSEKAADQLEAIIALQKEGNAAAILSETDKERYRRFKRRATGVLVGAAVGAVAGSRAMSALDADVVSQVPTTPQVPVTPVQPMTPPHNPLVVNIEQWTDYDGIAGSNSASTFIEASGDLQDQIRNLPVAQRARYSELLGMDREALAQKLGGYRPGLTMKV